MSRRTRMTALALVTILVVGAGAAWLGLSYLGVISRDVRVQASVVSLGDSLGPGSKVRYHGLIVGTVHSVNRDIDANGAAQYGAELLIHRDQADSIPRDVKARVLPATLFGSEYVELVGGTASLAASGSALSSGDDLLADSSQGTVRLMDAIDDADRLLSAIDSDQINASTGALAEALDGHGDDIDTFIGDADDYVTTMTQHRGLLLADLELVGTASRTVAEMEPHLRGAAENSRTTAKTLNQKSRTIGELLVSSTALTKRGTALMNAESDPIIRLLRSTGPTLATFAAHDVDFTKVFDRVPIVLGNGAAGINDQAVQMEGLIDLNPLDPYTAADCPRYGSLAGTNCFGASGPTQSPSSDASAEAGDPAGLEDLAGVLQGLLEGLEVSP